MALTQTHSLGDTTVIAITDGGRDFDTGVFTSDPAHLGELLKAAGKETLQTNFNAFVVRTGGRTILVDAGPRDLFGPTAGNLLAGLAEAGIAPAQSDTLYITHLHPDHVAGALTPEGAAVFPQAELVVQDADRVFWSDLAETASDETLKGWAQLNVALLDAYGARLRVLTGEAEVAPGLTSIPLPGHTPGHAGFRVEGGGQALVHVGDLVHAQDVQLADPDVGVVFDVDGDLARATRKRLLDQLAGEDTLVTGGHILAPKFGHVRRAGRGYRFEAL